MQGYTIIHNVCRQIKEKFEIERIFVFHIKTNAQNISSFKVCVITAQTDPYRLEHDIYLNVESAIPFDVVAYTTQQWESLHTQPTSFAKQIETVGEVFYERASQ